MSKEKPDAWMPLYVADWDGDTGDLTCEEDGAYGRIVRYYWRNGPPSDDDKKLARIVRMDVQDWVKIRPVLEPFFTIKKRIWTHKRIDSEIVRSTQKRSQAIDRAKKGAAGRWPKKGDASSIPQASLNECPSSSSSPATLRGSKKPLSASDGKAFSNSDFRQKAVAERGEDWVRSWLDQCGWRDLPSPAIICPRQLVAERIRRGLRGALQGVSVMVEAATG